MALSRPTLKSRIKKMISLSITATVILSGLLLFIIILLFSRTGISLMTKNIGFNISQQMNSKGFLAKNRISSLEYFNPSDHYAKEWFKKLNTINTFDLSLNQQRDEKDFGEDTSRKFLPQNKIPFLNVNMLISIKIDIKGKTIFTNKGYNDEHHVYSQNRNILNKGINNFTELKDLDRLFTDSDAIYELYDSKGVQIGSVTCTPNNYYIFNILSFIICLIIIISLVSLFASELINRMFMFPVIYPMEQFSRALKHAANEEYEGCEPNLIKLNRPLPEFQELAESVNTIIEKMKVYNDKLYEQNLSLQDSYDELERQNEELLSSRKKIEEQQALLENQYDELEVQNQELMESKAKIEEQQTLLIQTESMYSIGQLTASISHEINTPLAAISSNVQLFDTMFSSFALNTVINQDETLQQTLQQIKESNDINIIACSRINEIIKSLRNFIKLDQAEFQKANITEGIRSCLTLSSNLWKNRIKINTELNDIPYITCYPGMLNQVFMNILGNAIEAIEGSGEIFIRTSYDENYVYISFRDTGKGIPSEYIDKIFDQRFSKKKNGMGMGLSICKSIVNKHNGEIRVKSTVNEGTEFTIVLPIDLNAEAADNN